MKSGEPRGGGACRESDRRRWGSVAGTESLQDDTAENAVPRQYAVCIGGACAVGGCLQPPAVHGWCCVMRAGAVVGGAVAGGRLRESRRCDAADNPIGDDGAASLSPSLLRMTQLTSLVLCGTLYASAGPALWAGACNCRLSMDDVVCWRMGRLFARLQGAAACEGLQCLQAIRSETMGQRRWHRVS